MNPFSNLIHSHYFHSRRRLLIGAICGVCICAIGIACLVSYRHFHQAPQEERNSLRYPVFDPIMNAREVTIDVVRVDWARELKGTIEAAAKVFGKYIPGKVRIVEESTVTLNLPLEKKHLDAIIQRRRVRGPSVITIVIAPYSLIGDRGNIAMTYLPWSLCDSSGHIIIVRAEAANDYSSSGWKMDRERMWRHMLTHELCHVFSLPADPARRIRGNHCKDRNCVLALVGMLEQRAKGYAPPFDLCDDCRREMVRLRMSDKRRLQDYTDLYDVSLWYDELVRMNPRDPLAYVARGSLFHHRGEYARAISNFTTAIRLAPKRAKGFSGRAQEYVAISNPQKAIDDYTIALRLDQRDASNWCYRGMLFAALADCKRAISDISQSLSLEPKNSNYAQARAMVYRDSGDYPRALSDLERSIHFGWYNSDALALRGILYLDAFHDPGKALDDLSHAASLSPGEARIYARRARAYGALKDYGKASADFEKALHLEPEIAEANHAFIEFLVDCPDTKFQDMDRAVALASEHYDALPWKNAKTVEALAKACADKKSYASALQYQEKAMSLIQDKSQKVEMEKTLSLYKRYLVR